MNLWKLIAATAISLGWLLPNHAVPWTTFHSDALVASVLIIVALVSWVKYKLPQAWTYFAILSACVCLVPLLQFNFGLIKSAGIAWVSTAYLFGFLLAILAGARLESAKPNAVLNILFLAIGMAATISVGIQTCQWLRVNDGCLCNEQWIIVYTTASRYSANLGHPNQLATLLIWGILAYGWAWQRQIVSAKVAALGSGILLLGLALTDSRTGVLLLFVMVGFSWLWRGLWSSRSVPIFLTALSLVYFVFMWSLPPLSAALHLDYSSTLAARTKSESRFDLWTLFASAALHRPWFGYGWEQVIFAQVLPTTVMPENLVGKGLLATQTHNLFLDFVLWAGIPLGLFLSAALITWGTRMLLAVKNRQAMFPALLVLVVAIHAMLELPLHYGYFLLPTGLVIGVLDVQLAARKVFASGRVTAITMGLSAGLLLGVIVRDYFAVEESFNELRLEKARIVTKIPRPPPEVLLLTQLRDFIILARYVPSDAVTAKKLQWIEDVTLAYPAYQNMVKLAATYALNDQQDNAKIWLSRVCIVASVENCGFAKAYWSTLQVEVPRLKTVTWPSD